MKNDMLHLGTIDLPVEAVTKTFAILAKKGAGKSYTAGVMEEEFYNNGIPFVIFDPIDVHWGLRLMANGKTPGLPIVVFGVFNADIQLTEDMGKQIAHAVVDKNISCVISTFGMSKKGQRKLITEFSEELLHINNTPRHIFIEEAHEFVPQRVTSDLGRCFAAVEALVVMGRNRGLGVTLINQRAATINKDVLTQIDTLLAFRNVAPQDRKALKEWVEVHASEDDFNEFWSSLPSLPTGEGWLWSPEWLGKFTRIKIRKRVTLHPDRESMEKPIDLQEHAPEDIQKFILEFNKKKITEDFKVPKAVLGKVENVDGMKFPVGKKQLVVESDIQKVTEQFEQIIKDKDKEIDLLKATVRVLTQHIEDAKQALAGNVQKHIVEAQEEYIDTSPYALWIDKLPSGATRVLRLLKEKAPMKFTRSQLAVLTGVKLSTLVKNSDYLMTLKQNNLIIEMGGYIVINPDIL